MLYLHVNDGEALGLSLLAYRRQKVNNGGAGGIITSQMINSLESELLRFEAIRNNPVSSARRDFRPQYELNVPQSLGRQKSFLRTVLGAVYKCEASTSSHCKSVAVFLR